MSNNLGSYNNPLQGGWYVNPSSGQSQQYWNGGWFSTPQQGNSSSAPDPLAGYNSILGGLNNATNNYFNQQKGYYQTDFNNNQKLYDTQNTNLLGTQNQGARDAFLNSIYDPLLKQEGAYQYQYGLDTGHNTNVYGLNSTANLQNRNLALQKLATDEQNQLNDLALAHGQQNEQTAEDLNARGLLYGQKPTGMYQDANLGGMGGLAGQQAGLVNTNFANQRNEIVQPYNLGVLGTNQAYNQQQNMLDENHNYDLKNMAAGTVGNINNQNNQYTFNTATNQNQLAKYQSMLENQRQQQLANNAQTAWQKSLLSSNSYTGMS